jgi:DNA repair exonuclease SbcCD nuclease subunit
LGYAQFNLQEREEDLYEVFEESIDKSIQEHVEAIVLAGDIFHNPKPNGAAVIKLARELKKLKEKSIPVYFILGEHDISRTNDVPLPFLFHNLGLARRLKPDSPAQIKDLLIYGFNKERRSNIDNGLLTPFRKLEKIIKSDEREKSMGGKKAKKILVLHQGLGDFNKFAGEIFAKDLPLGFDYYAMGHYHDHVQKNFSETNDSLVAYPGSLDLGHNEPISDVEKGFLIVDLSEPGKNVTTSWIKVEKRRLQMNYSFEYGELDKNMGYLLELSGKHQKKPVLYLKLIGSKIDPKILSGELSKLNECFLYYTWNLFDKEPASGYSYDYANDFNIDREMSNLILKTMGSEDLASLSMDLIQMINNGEQRDDPSIDKNKRKQMVDYLWKYHENNKTKYHDGDKVEMK